MGLSGLDSALSGLRVAQKQLDVIGGNVANVGTDGYTRKILRQESVTVGGETVGVRASPVLRNVDLSLARDFWTQVSNISFLDTQATYLNKIQQFHGPPELEVSIAAEIAGLKDRFSALSDSPEDSSLQRGAVDQASTVARKINDLAALLNEMRNDTQDEMSVAVNRINSLLEQVAEANYQIKNAKVSGKTSASMEDVRDKAIKSLSEEIEISFFTRGDGVLVVQTASGVELAGEKAKELYLEKNPIGPDSYYPDSIGGLYVGGSPADNPNAINITKQTGSARIGALTELRDDILPRQQALLDELAHKLAQRFDQQGLRMFTDESGAIPADTAPVPNPPGPLNPAEYVGFSATIRVNNAILDNNRLVQQGTVPTDLPVPPGSNEVVRRVSQFVFGDVAYQQAQGTVDLRASAAGTTLQEWLGLYSQNQMTGAKDARPYADIDALIQAGASVFEPTASPVNDSFQITFEESRSAPPQGPVTITVDLTDADTNFPIGGAINNAADQIIAEINSQIALSGTPPGLAAQARLNDSGQIIIESRGNITVDASYAGGMGQAGLDLIGLSEGTAVTKDPYIDVQVGNDPPVRVSIEPGDDEFDLEAKLNKIAAGDDGVPGLAVDQDVTDPGGDGFLRLRPGDDPDNPRFGGDLKITGGPFETDGSGSIPAGMAAGQNVLSALFGTDSPISNVSYNSPTHTGGSATFRSQNLGPGANLDTGIISSTNLIDYSQKMVNRQTEEIISIDARRADEKSFHDLLQRRLLDESGVNLDEELSQMIVIQTAYSAAARVVSAIDEQFRELLRAV